MQWRQWSWWRITSFKFSKRLSKLKKKHEWWIFMWCYLKAKMHRNQSSVGWTEMSSYYDQRNYILTIPTAIQAKFNWWLEEHFNLPIFLSSLINIEVKMIHDDKITVLKGFCFYRSLQRNLLQDLKAKTFFRYRSLQKLWVEFSVY